MSGERRAGSVGRPEGDPLDARRSTLLFVGAAQVVTCAGPARARRGGEMRDCGVAPAGTAVAVDGGRVTEAGSLAELEARFADAERVDCGGRLLTPGLVDSHTHAIFGRPRHAEQEMRAMGLPYMEIAARGGGIHASVRDLRGRTEDELVALALPRLRRIAAHGTTTVEVKSGYGLTLEDELKTLRAIRRLQALLPLRLVPTWLGAHEIPQEARARGDAGRREYLRLLVHEMLPAVAGEGLARFADVFCEPGVYTVAESRVLLEAAREAGLGLKLHADELQTSGAAELAVALGAASADHLAAVSDDGVRALAGGGTVATLLPGTMLFLGSARQAPARTLVDAGAAVALASDFNPGTSPTVNFPLVLTLAVSQLRLTAAEAVVGATVNGAAALALAGDVGQLAPGFRADLALFDAEDVRELPYWYGDRRCRGTWVDGVACHPYEAAAHHASGLPLPTASPTR
ncbi:imidazolonepropionase [Roseisolibacter sp. H3M3-2]|uniref:imidazolonepropionase n=1 Tax=Roseisolibacter sp. H3M3-2 TaxID=3031323 RepID=UPI0023D9DB4E|nr:imidazolonepropionase [Roseisolibacter sp. H3M3-2]MDF1502709.1 imidazolonepropionase [Roseisolibacter sp. H3M3-2]